jgi:ribosome maturation factor RimP
MNQSPNTNSIGSPHRQGSHGQPNGQPNDRLHELMESISHLIFPLGYRVIDLEIQSHRQKVLRIFIDYLEANQPGPKSPSDGLATPEVKALSGKIGIDDCVKVTRALDESLDKVLESGSWISGPYELEVSSPGISRALRTSGDFQKYSDSKVRIHVFRPLTAEELENASYQAINPKQKNFLGILSGVRESKVVLSLSLGEKKAKKKGQKPGSKKGNSLPTNSEEESQKTILIPLPLISKANLEPDFDFEESNERE